MDFKQLMANNRANNKSGLRIGIYGDAGSGKTSFALAFPTLYTNEKDGTNKVKYLLDIENKVPSSSEYSPISQSIKDLEDYEIALDGFLKDPSQLGVLIIDSITQLFSFVEKQIAKSNPGKAGKNELANYRKIDTLIGLHSTSIINKIVALSSKGVHIICIFHPERRNESTVEQDRVSKIGFSLLPKIASEFQNILHNIYYIDYNKEYSASDRKIKSDGNRYVFTRDNPVLVTKHASGTEVPSKVLVDSRPCTAKISRTHNDWNTILNWKPKPAESKTKNRCEAEVKAEAIKNDNKSEQTHTN